MDRSVIIKSTREGNIFYESFPYELLRTSDESLGVLTQDKFFTLSTETLSKTLNTVKTKKQTLGLRIVIYSMVLLPGLILGILFTYNSLFINLVFLSQLSNTQQTVISFFFHLSLIFFTGVIYSIYTQVYKVQKFSPSDYILPNLKLIDLNDIPQPRTNYLNYFSEDVLNSIISSIQGGSWNSLTLLKLILDEPDCQQLLNSLELDISEIKLPEKEFPKLSYSTLNSFLTVATQFAIETNNEIVTAQNILTAFLYVFPYFYIKFPQLENYHTLVAATQIESPQKIIKTAPQIQLTNIILHPNTRYFIDCVSQVYAKSLRISAPLSIRISSILRAHKIPNVALFPNILQKENFINATSHEHRGPVFIINLEKAHNHYIDIGPEFAENFLAIKENSVVFIDGWDENPGILKRTQPFIKSVVKVLTQRKCRIFVILNSNVAQNYDLKEILGLDVMTPMPEDIETDISTIQNFLNNLKPTTIALYVAYILSDVIYPIKDRVSATITYLQRFSIPNIDSDRVFKSTSQILEKPKQELESIIYLSRREEEVYAEVIGQKHAVKKIFKALKRKMIFENKDVATILSFLLVAPTKWGKRHLTTVIHEKLFPDKKLAVLQVGKGTLKSALQRAKGSATLVFENIEKAKPSELNLILNLLANGTVTLNRKPLDFKASLIFLTISSLPKEYFSERQLPHITIENLMLLKIKHLIDARLFSRLEGLAVLELPDMYEILEYIRTFVVTNDKKLDSATAIELARKLYEKGSSYSKIHRELQKLPSV